MTVSMVRLGETVGRQGEPMVARVRASTRRDDGASAVEFALLAPLLFALLFGIIQYGLWFGDSLSMKQGVREAARQGVVANFGTDTSCGTSNGQRLLCTTKDRIGGITGAPLVKVVAPSGWVKGKPLIVCAQMDVTTPTGFIPLPNDGVITSKVEMSVENVDGVTSFSGAQDAPPPGKDWSWCT
jgi:hypothetical protein